MTTSEHNSCQTNVNTQWHSSHIGQSRRSEIHNKTKPCVRSFQENANKSLTYDISQLVSGHKTGIVTERPFFAKLRSPLCLWNARWGCDKLKISLLFLLLLIPPLRLNFSSDSCEKRTGKYPSVLHNWLHDTSSTFPNWPCWPFPSCSSKLAVERWARSHLSLQGRRHFSDVRSRGAFHSREAPWAYSVRFAKVRGRDED